MSDEEQPEEQHPADNDNQSFRRPESFRRPDSNDQAANRGRSTQNANESHHHKHERKNKKKKANMIVMAIIIYILTVAILATFAMVLIYQLKTDFQDKLDNSNTLMAEELFNLKAELDKYKTMMAPQYNKDEKNNDDVKNDDVNNDDVNTSNEFLAGKIKLINIKLEETQDAMRKSITVGKSCEKLLANGQTLNKVYWITGITNHPFEAYCDMEAGGYMVFLRRFDGSLKFRKDFDHYKNGFGSATGEYWLGLERLHQFTKKGRHQLHVYLVAYDGQGYQWKPDAGDTAFAVYEDFSIGAGPGYQLHIGEYNGTAGDSLRVHNNMDFSTYEHDADQWVENSCAQLNNGAFWHNHCTRVNLMGFWYDDKRSLTGMWWYDFNDGYPLKESTMMVL